MSKPLAYVCVVAAVVEAYKPVVMMHGLNGAAGDFNGYRAWIEEAHPGTKTVSLPVDERELSFLPLALQMQNILDYMANLQVSDNITLSEGFHFIGHSQGALLTRSILEVMPAEWQVINYISLAGPQMGQFGIPEASNWPEELQWLAELGRDVATDLLYSPGLNQISFAQFWNDPKRQEDFLRLCPFLPAINNLNEFNATLKANFLRSAQRQYYYGSGADEVIVPGEGAGWMYYNDRADGLVPMKSQRVYVEDLFGLRTLDEEGRLEVKLVPGILHNDWTRSKDVFLEFVLDKLT